MAYKRHFIIIVIIIIRPNSSVEAPGFLTRISLQIIFLCWVVTLTPTPKQSWTMDDLLSGFSPLVGMAPVQSAGNSFSMAVCSLPRTVAWTGVDRCGQEWTGVDRSASGWAGIRGSSCVTLVRLLHQCALVRMRHQYALVLMRQQYALVRMR
jgi:hypothetical protein